MISKRYVAYAVFAILLIAWLLEIESRNEQFPQIQDIKLEEVKGESQVNFHINNPRDERVRVATHIRLQSPGQGQANREFAASPVTVLTYDIEPQSELSIEHLISNVGRWSEADVQLYVLDDSTILRESHLDRLSGLMVDRLQELFK